MARKIGSAKVDELEPYRQLIEIQKQLVKLSRQHEKTKRECAELREKLAREVMESRNRRPKLNDRLRKSAADLLKRLPSLPGAPAAKALLGASPRKQASSC